MYEQYKQCTYNVKYKRVRVIIVAVEKQYYIFWVCVCSLTYPAGKAHAPYCGMYGSTFYFPNIIS